MQYLVSLIGIYPCDEGDYTVRLYSNQQKAKRDFNKMVKEMTNYYTKENVRYSVGKSDGFCQLRAENGDKVTIFLQAIHTDGIIHNYML